MIINFFTYWFSRNFHNIPVFIDDLSKTAAISPSGFVEYCRIPFGVRNAFGTSHFNALLILFLAICLTVIFLLRHSCFFFSAILSGSISLWSSMKKRIKLKRLHVILNSFPNIRVTLNISGTSNTIADAFNRPYIDAVFFDIALRLITES